MLRCTSPSRRSSYGVYDPAEDNNTAKRLSLIGDLRRAIDNNEFVLYYQPKVNLADGTVIATGSAHTLAASTARIPTAQRIYFSGRTDGLIAPLSMWVLEAALRQTEQWQKSGYDLSVAVNLSARNLQDGTLPRKIRQLLSTHHVGANSLTLEITESAVMNNPEEAVANLQELRDMGVRLSIDDFGTGYSSLTI